MGQWAAQHEAVDCRSIAEATPIRWACAEVCYTVTMKDSPMSIRLGHGQRDRLEQIAREDDRSVGWLIRKAVEEYLQRREG